MRKHKLLVEDAGRCWNEAEYALLDFGDGRKLEKFGRWILDRPCPAAIHENRASLDQWKSAMVVVAREGQVIQGGIFDEAWNITFSTIKLSLNLTPFGHIGVFPEQATNWLWIDAQLRQAMAATHRPLESGAGGETSYPPQPPQILNLFGYTGGMTLVCAASGCRVTHVDASAPTVAWARRNAELSGLAEAPIRWIVDDVRKFVGREMRRGNKYHAIVLDPPSYGHGTSGKSWEIQRDLPDLMRACAQLLNDSWSLIVLSCHSEHFGCNELSDLLVDSLELDSEFVPEATRMTIHDSHHRALDMGAVVRAHVLQIV